MLDAFFAPRRLHFLRPHTPPSDGLTAVPVDLSVLFELIPRVGRAGALLLLTLRALRQRAARSPENTVGQVALTEIAWVLRATPRQVRWWLHRLSQHRLLVYHLDSARATATLTIEFVPEPIRPPRFDDSRRRHAPFEMPSHWVLHTLPRLGRTVFFSYLYLLSREPDSRRGASLRLDDLSATLDLWGVGQAWLVLLALRRHRLLIRHPRNAGFIVRDPAPLTRWQRFVLRARAAGRWPRTRTALSGWWVVSIVVILAGVFLLLRQ